MSFLTSLRPALQRSPLLSTSNLLLQSSSSSSAITRSFTTTPVSRLARINIVGRLADTPEIVPTSSGQEVIRYALGTNHGPKDNRQTSWWRVSSFMPEGPGRDLLVGLGKGSQLYVEGDCSMNGFVNNEGKPQKQLNIVQRNFEILDRRQSGDENGAEGGMEAEQGQA